MRSINEPFTKVLDKLYLIVPVVVAVGQSNPRGEWEMGKETLGMGGSAVIASKSVIARLNLDIEQYEGLLRSSLGPKARKMFEQGELCPISAEITPSQG